MKVIPAIDVIDGKVVRLHKGNYSKMTVYSDNIVEEAKKFADAGFNRIHIVDLDGARSGRFENLKYISEIATKLNMIVQTGGGIRKLEDFKVLSDAGIQYFISNSLAVRANEVWLEAINTYSNRCILGLDLLNGKIAYSGWEKLSSMSVQEFVSPMISAGMDTILSTDISKDGTLTGPNFDLYQDLQSKFPKLNIIASGGVSVKGDLVRLNEQNVWGCVVGKAYYENRLSLSEMSSF